MTAQKLNTNLDAAGDRTRILVVDDSAVIRKAATKMLGKDFDVVVANDGEQGWSRIQKDTSIQVVFTDINMPKLDGYGFIERVRTCNDEGIRNLPLIVITSEDAESGAKEKVFKLGATDFIAKPFNSFDLKARATAHSNYQRLTRVLQEQSNIDHVSGLFNHRGFVEQLNRDLSRIRREQLDMALFQIEINNFKDIFLRVGREPADKIIQLVAKILTSLVRKEDSLCRQNLSTFSVWLPAANPACAAELAQRMSDAITSIKASLKGEALQFHVSVGVCTVASGFSTDADTLILESQQALHTAKHLGHGNVHTCCVKKKAALDNTKQVSIDRLLAQIKHGKTSIDAQQLQLATRQLVPLVKLLDDENKQHLVSCLD